MLEDNKSIISSRYLFEVLGVIGYLATVIYFFVNLFSWSFGLGLTTALNLNSTLLPFNDSFNFFSPIAIEYVASYLILFFIGFLSSVSTERYHSLKIKKKIYLYIFGISFVIITISTFDVVIDKENNVNVYYHLLTLIIEGLTTILLGKLFNEQFELKTKIVLLIFATVINLSSLKLYTYLYGFESGIKMFQNEKTGPSNSPNAKNKFPMVKIIAKNELLLRSAAIPFRGSFLYQSTDSSFVKLLFEINGEKFFIESYKNKRRTISVQNDLIEQIIYE